MNNKGVVDEYRRPKLCYETVKRIFREDRESEFSAKTEKSPGSDRKKIAARRAL